MPASWSSLDMCIHFSLSYSPCDSFFESPPPPWPHDRNFFWVESPCTFWWLSLGFAQLSQPPSLSHLSSPPGQKYHQTARRFHEPHALLDARNKQVSRHLAYTYHPLCLHNAIKIWRHTHWQQPPRGFSLFAKVSFELRDVSRFESLLSSKSVAPAWYSHQRALG